MTGLSYDLSPLSGARPPQEVRSQFRPIAPVAAWTIGGFVVFIALVTTLVQGIGGTSEDWVIGSIFISFGVLLGLAVWLVARLVDRRTAGRSAKIAAFARTNGFRYDGEGENFDLPRTYGHKGWRSTVYDRVRWSVRGLSAEAGRYSRREYQTYTNCFFVAVRVDISMEPATFKCGRSGPTTFGARWKGPDAFEGRSYSLRAEHEVDPRMRELFDDAVVAMLVDDEWPCNAEYINGFFWAYYRSGDSSDPGRWQHMLALADAVAARKPALIGQT